MSFTNTPAANVDGLHERSSVFTHFTAPRSSMLISPPRRAGFTARCLDSIEVVKLQHRSIEPEHLKREAVVQAVQGRLALETLQERTRHVLFDLAIPVQKLPPEGHVAKSMLEPASRREVRRRKQTTIRLEVVEPRRPTWLHRRYTATCTHARMV